MEIQEINQDTVLLRGRHLVTFEDGPSSGGALPKVSGGFAYKSEVRDRYEGSNDIGGLRRVSLGDGAFGYMKCWGKDNQAPLRLEQSIRSNALLPSLLDTKVKIIQGQRPYMFYERYENDKEGKMKRIEDEEPMPPEIEDFYLESEEHRYFQMLCGQWAKNGNPITEFLPSKNADIAGLKIAALKAHEAKFWRKEEIGATGKVENAYFQGNAWASRGKVSRTYPIRKIKMWQGADTDITEPFLYWTGNPMFCYDDYYYSTVWEGSLPWAGLMNVVPLFHDNNLNNMFVTPVHFRLRKGMFLDKKAYDSAKTDEIRKKLLSDEAEARTRWLKSANEVMAGVENAGRAIWSEEEILSGVQKQFPDVEIIPLKIDLHDDALLKVDEAGRKAVMSSAQIHPTIANVETAGKLSSGSEMGNAVRMQRLIHTPDPRKNILEAWHLAMRLNEWHKKYARKGRAPKFWFADEEIVVTSESKTGTQEVDN
jgi:hypothetical protein